MSSDWQWRLLVAGFVGLIAFGWYRECRQGAEQRDDARLALRCVLGKPPLAAADVAARYREIHAAALRRGVAHPHGCAPYFERAGVYHGNASSPVLARQLLSTAELLRGGDEAAIIARLQALVAEIGFDER